MVHCHLQPVRPQRRLLHYLLPLPCRGLRWHAHGSNAISRATASDCRSYCRYSMAPPIRKPLGHFSSFSHCNRWFRRYSTLMHARNGYFVNHTYLYWGLPLTKSNSVKGWCWIQLFILMLIQCPKVIQQPKVIQLTSGPGYSFYSYAYSMPQCNSAAKSYPADEWSWIQLLFLCLFNAPK